jgi:Nif-specific regulatory protein
VIQPFEPSEPASAASQDAALIALFHVGKTLCVTPAIRSLLSEVVNALCEHLHLASAGVASWVAATQRVELAATAGFGPAQALLGKPGDGSPALAVAQQGSALVLPHGPEASGRFVGPGWLVPSAPYVGMPIRSPSGKLLGILELQLGGESPVTLQRLVLLAEMVTTLVGQQQAAWWQEEPALDDAQARNAERANHSFESIVGSTSAMRRVFAQVRQVAKWNTTVLIMGESGTGKELIANAIHSNSSRSRGPFVKLNCAALPDSLLESELFGHEKGAFTGALTRHSGRFEQAHRGTLFLDEIGEISPSFQAKLLRVLQEGEYERLGGTQTLQVDVRVIAATNKDLEQEVEENRFRRDLFYRLNVMPIFTPALRERRDDVAQLAEHLTRKLAQVHGRSIELTEGAIKLLTQHDWPGNVRELENTLERAAIMSEGGTIDAEAVMRAGVPGERASGSMIPPVADLRDPNIDERERVLAALERAGWVQARAARLLGMTPRQVAYRIQILKIDVPRF